MEEGGAAIAGNVSGHDAFIYDAVGERDRHRWRAHVLSGTESWTNRGAFADAWWSDFLEGGFGLWPWVLCFPPVATR